MDVGWALLIGAVVIVTFALGVRLGVVALLIPVGVVVVGLTIAQLLSNETSGYLTDRDVARILTILAAMPIAAGTVLGVITWGLISVTRGWRTSPVRNVRTW